MPAIAVIANAMNQTGEKLPSANCVKFNGTLHIYVAYVHVDCGVVQHSNILVAGADHSISLLSVFPALVLHCAGRHVVLTCMYVTQNCVG